MNLCTYMDRGEDAEEAPSLLSYTLTYISLAELGTVCRVGLREPMHLCACVGEEYSVFVFNLFCFQSFFLKVRGRVAAELRQTISSDR